MRKKISNEKFQKQKLVVGNWKLNPGTVREAIRLFEGAKKAAQGLKNVKVVVCPPAVYLGHLLASTPYLAVGAQDAFWANEGPYTGEVGPRILARLGAKYVIVGHSERRANAGETDEVIAKKVKMALLAGLRAILCVGERERGEDKEYVRFVKKEITEGLKLVGRPSAKDIIVAYEPIWAISSAKGGRADTPEDALEMAIFIHKVLFDLYGIVSERIPVLYGGSVIPENVSWFLERAGVDGVLVGRASTNVKSFGKIIQIAEQSGIAKQ